MNKLKKVIASVTATVMITTGLTAVGMTSAQAADFDSDCRLPANSQGPEGSTWIYGGSPSVGAASVEGTVMDEEGTYYVTAGAAFKPTLWAMDYAIAQNSGDWSTSCVYAPRLQATLTPSSSAVQVAQVTNQPATPENEGIGLTNFMKTGNVVTGTFGSVHAGPDHGIYNQTANPAIFVAPAGVPSGTRFHIDVKANAFPPVTPYGVSLDFEVTNRINFVVINTTPPNAPNNLQGAKKSETMVELNWSKPGENNSSPVKEYEVQLGDGETFTTTSTHTIKKVTSSEVNEDGSVTAEVRAVNEDDLKSPAARTTIQANSNPTNPVTPTNPTKPKKKKTAPVAPKITGFSSTETRDPSVHLNKRIERFEKEGNDLQIRIKRAGAKKWTRWDYASWISYTNKADVFNIAKKLPNRNKGYWVEVRLKNRKTGAISRSSRSYLPPLNKLTRNIRAISYNNGVAVASFRKTSRTYVSQRLSYKKLRTRTVRVKGKKTRMYLYRPTVVGKAVKR